MMGIGYSALHKSSIVWLKEEPCSCGALLFMSSLCTKKPEVNAMPMTEIQRFRIQLAAQILSAKLEDTVLAANRTKILEPTKALIEGSLQIANELINEGLK
jgi:hypothetical protein